MLWVRWLIWCASGVKFLRAACVKGEPFVGLGASVGYVMWFSCW